MAPVRRARWDAAVSGAASAAPGVLRRVQSSAWAAGLLALALFASGCAGGDAEGDEEPGFEVSRIDDEPVGGTDTQAAPAPDLDPEPDPAPEADPAPEPEEPEPLTDDEADSEADEFAVPDEIDEAYVDSVMNYILARDSAVLADILSRPTGEDLHDIDSERLEAVLSGPRLTDSLSDKRQTAQDESHREPFRSHEDLGDARWETEAILDGSSSCIVALGLYDLTERLVENSEDDIFALVALAPQTVVSDQNRTGWTLHDLVPLMSGGEPIPRESWDRIDHSSALTTTCDPEGES